MNKPDSSRLYTGAHLRTAPLRPPADLIPLSQPPNQNMRTKAVRAIKPMSPSSPSDTSEINTEQTTAIESSVPDSTVFSTPFNPDHFLPQQTIKKQRDGEEISDEEISMFVQGIADESITEGQCAAYAMAVHLCGMTGGELVSLTKCMRDSGEVLQWDLDGPILSQKSTGGVGDLSSILLAPIIAGCGGYVPMITGESLAHTNSSLDKLSSIPGYRTSPSLGRFQRTVKDSGCAIINQTEHLAPADKRLRAIRNITSTIESLPLITSSLLAPQLAAGVDSLVVDIKAGNGGFIPDIISAQKLAQKIADVARACGLKFTSVVTDMNQPLAYSVGNALEIKEAIRFLHTRRGRNPRLYSVVMALGEELLVDSGLADTTVKAREKLDYALDSGLAAEHFGRMIRALGGPTDFVERPKNHLKEANIIKPVFHERSGIIHRINTHKIGQAIHSIGKIKAKTGTAIAPSVGLTEIQVVSDTLDSRTPIAQLHASNENDWEHAAQLIRQAYQLGSSSANLTDPVIERIKPARQQ